MKRSKYQPEQFALNFLSNLTGAESSADRDLRAQWDRERVPKEKQDAIIREIEDKAKPGAMVGPFKITE